MEEERPLLDEVLDLALYAPIGLALTVAEDLPGLIQKGRTRFASQVGAARIIGRFAMRSARRRIEGMFDSSPEEATVTVLPRRPVVEAPTFRRDDAVDLAIANYDTLAASQVVARLPSLSRDELDIVEAHELAHKRRTTVLTRITQLKG
jgi:hypothetical protein